MWSVGGRCDANSREKFSDFVKETVSGTTDGHPIPAAVVKWKCPMDERGSVYDYFYEVPCDSVPVEEFYLFHSVNHISCTV